MLLVNNVAVGTTHTCSLSVGAAMQLKCAMNGLMLFSKARWSGLRKMAARAMERADFVNQRPCWTWVMCLSLLGIAFAGQ